jgi:hypothetical protein
VLHDAGITWQRDRTWCETGVAIRKRKQSCGCGTIDDPADLGHIRHAVALDTGYGADFAEQLHDEPDADEHQRGDERHAYVLADHQQRLDLIARIGDDECAHDRGDGATGPERGYAGGGIGDDLGERGH